MNENILKSLQDISLGSQKVSLNLVNDAENAMSKAADAEGAVRKAAQELAKRSNKAQIAWDDAIPIVEDSLQAAKELGAKDLITKFSAWLRAAKGGRKLMEKTTAKAKSI